MTGSRFPRHVALIAAAMLVASAGTAAAAPPTRFELRVSGEQISTATLRQSDCNGNPVSAAWSERFTFRSRRATRITVFRHRVAPLIVPAGRGSQVTLGLTGTVERTSGLTPEGNPPSGCPPESLGTQDCGKVAIRFSVLLQALAERRYRGLWLSDTALRPEDPFNRCPAGRGAIAMPDFLDEEGGQRCFGEGELDPFAANVPRSFLYGRGRRLTKTATGTLTSKCDDSELAYEGSTTTRWTIKLKRTG